MANDKPPSSSQPRTLKDRILDLFSSTPADRDDLIDLVRAAEENNILEPDALAMIEGALEVCDMRVRDIMIPRIQMVVIDIEAELDEILKIVIDSGHSRFPVIDLTNDEVKGILLAKDLLQIFVEKKSSSFNVESILRPAVFVPESKRLNVLLREFRSSRNHMAMIVDEYVNLAGLVTIEDVIEEIVGEIEDEHDVEEDLLIQQQSRNRFTVEAMTPIDEFNEFFSTDISDDEFDTIGGYVLNAFGHVPKRGETKLIEGFNVKILRSDKRRIHLMRFTLRDQGNKVTEDTN